jgi:hypothetical protein
MSATQMIIRTGKVRRGDTVVQQVPDADNPYREVTLTEQPLTAELFYQGRWHMVRYMTGFDAHSKRVVKFTGTEHQVWQIIREG